MEEIRKKNMFKLQLEKMKNSQDQQLQKSHLIQNLCQYLESNPKHQLICYDSCKADCEEKLKSEYEHKFKGLLNKPFLSLKKHF